MKKTTKKLTLNTETIIRLTNLDGVRGGEEHTSLLTTVGTSSLRSNYPTCRDSCDCLPRTGICA